MAYNFKNVLVNLNEEIRKGGGGGGDLPAVKLDVSQLKIDVSKLQVSMAAVKGSVAIVSGEVDRIKGILSDLMSYTASDKVQIGTWSDGRPVWRQVFTFDSEISVSNSTWTTTTIPKGDKDLLLHAELVGASGAVYPSSAICYEQAIDYVRLMTARSATVNVKTVILDFVETAPVQKRR